ncbi:MAG TPA: diaminopimelate epimerase [Propionibacteriaceae bacterium]|nr:diaminopimelate epimerase [Propionibacteriaceae bacterium]
MRRWSFTKGHGTENDFVLILDRESMLEVEPAEVRFICNRRAGVGADGLIRAVLAKHVDGWEGDGALWFMDYRNADGSIAEMCGNGIRVFVRYLLDQDLVSGPVVEIATRDGLKVVTALPDGRIRVTMGEAVVGSQAVIVTTADGAEFKAFTVDVGNPHAVSFVDDLDPLQLHAPPRWDPAEEFPDGINLEFVRRLGTRHIGMRVYERGVGETHSCGTGTVAAAAAARFHDQDLTSLPGTYRVDTLGGSVEVELTPHEAYLTGPAVLVAHGELALPEHTAFQSAVDSGAAWHHSEPA